MRLSLYLKKIVLLKFYRASGQKINRISRITGVGKINRFGQAAILSDVDVRKIKKALDSPTYELMLAIALCTAERWGAIVQLQVSDCYADPVRGLIRSEITFRAHTRKATPSGMRATRQVPINHDLAAALSRYSPPLAGWLFPSPTHSNKPVSFQAVDKALRTAIAKCGLTHKGISTHSTRRTAITKMYREGIDILSIKQVTGHRSMSSLMRYIESDPTRVNAALAVLNA